MFKLITAILVAVALATSAACSSSEGEEAPRFGEDSPMFAIQDRGEIHIAVPEDSWPFAGKKAGDDAGFLIDLGNYIAEDLEVDPVFRPADSETMSHLIAHGDVDVAFPLRPVTHDALRDETATIEFAFASPFFVAHQRLLVPRDSGIEQVSDLSGKKVCSLINEDTEVDVAKLVDVEVETATDLHDCETALLDANVTAVTAPDVWLAIMAADLQLPPTYRGPSPAVESTKIVGDDLSTEGYAAMTIPGPMTTYVIGVLNDVEDDGLWIDSYNRWLADYMGPVAGPPDLTLQDAAALFPPEVTPTPSP